ncbi:hypothetical protein [Bradyrhizobium valentinum]|uniref:Uncharacterized protein n=1 Tax=Bradyrhizobium valentinum TaxID=1518501 RepID=A0A0R3LU61_9BRAD|nr:hypothetical protein [Bradyrhizobium valentinum]KRR11532.1 hypothetical protein CP49_18020 [Bradyrhizobium valentinum]
MPARPTNPLDRPVTPPTKAEVLAMTTAEISALLDDLSRTPPPAARRREALQPSWGRIAAQLNARVR